MDDSTARENQLSPFSRKLVELIERDARELALAYLREVKRNPNMATYQSFPPPAARRVSPIRFVELAQA